MLASIFIAAIAQYGKDFSILTPEVAYAAPIELVNKREEWLDALSSCENPEWPKIQRIVDSNGYYSYGPYMFQMSTWLRYSALLGTTKENIYDAGLQKKVTEYVLDHGGVGNWWTCGHYVEKSLVPWP